MTDDSSPTDRELWRRATDGHVDSFGVIFDRHATAVHSYCYRRTSSSHIAQDLVSIVFLEAWRRRHEIDLHEESALPWLLGVAHRVVRQRHRSTVRHRAAMARLPAAIVEPDHADGVASRLDDQRRIQQVQKAFARLNRNDQDVLALCVGQGLDYAAAAVALGVPIGTVRSRLSRARRRLSELGQTSSSIESGPDLAVDALGALNPAISPVSTNSGASGGPVRGPTSSPAGRPATPAGACSIPASHPSDRCNPEDA